MILKEEIFCLTIFCHILMTVIRCLTYISGYGDKERRPTAATLSVNPSVCSISVRIVRVKVFVTPVVELWLKREIAQWAYWWGFISNWPCIIWIFTPLDHNVSKVLPNENIVQTTQNYRIKYRKNWEISTAAFILSECVIHTFARYMCVWVKRPAPISASQGL